MKVAASIQTDRHTHTQTASSYFADRLAIPSATIPLRYVLSPGMMTSVDERLKDLELVEGRGREEVNRPC